jgi:hypothetical protein
MQSEGRARRIRGERAEPGAAEVAVVARLLGPVSQLSYLRGRGRNDKPGYYEGSHAWQELPPLKTMHFPAVSKLPKFGYG